MILPLFPINSWLHATSFFGPKIKSNVEQNFQFLSATSCCVDFFQVHSDPKSAAITICIFNNGTTNTDSSGTFLFICYNGFLSVFHLYILLFPSVCIYFLCYLIIGFGNNMVEGYKLRTQKQCHLFRFVTMISHIFINGFACHLI